MSIQNFVEPLAFELIRRLIIEEGVKFIINCSDSLEIVKDDEIVFKVYAPGDVYAITPETSIELDRSTGEFVWEDDDVIIRAKPYLTLTGDMALALSALRLAVEENTREELDGDDGLRLENFYSTKTIKQLNI